MGISTEITDRRKALIDRLLNPPDPDMEVFGQIKKMLNGTFGEENNQIIKGVQSPYIDVWKKRFEAMDDRMFRSHTDETLWNSIVDSSGSEFNIVIRFPHITIRNDRKESHEITDLFVKVPLSKEGFINSIQGTRGAITPEECAAQYRHSHLPRKEDGSWDYFCLGEGPLAMMIPIMSRKYKPEQFQLFLYNLREYVAWESISGTPYIRMNTVKNRTGNIHDDITTIAEGIRNRYMDVTLTYLRGLGKSALHNYLDVKLEGSKFVVTITENLESVLTNHFMDRDIRTYNVDLSMYMCYKNTDGKYVSGAIADAVLLNQTTPIITFKGEQIFLKIIKKEEDVKESKKYLHPVFKHELETRISNYFNNSYSTYNRAKSGDSSTNF